MVKLNNTQIEEIKKLINKSVKVSDIAKQYNVSTTAIYNIKKNKNDYFYTFSKFGNNDIPRLPSNN